MNNNLNIINGIHQLLPGILLVIVCIASFIIVFNFGIFNNKFFLQISPRGNAKRSSIKYTRIIIFIIILCRVRTSIIQ